jgi:hypothetical protein
MARDTRSSGDGAVRRCVPLRRPTDVIGKLNSLTVVLMVVGGLSAGVPWPIVPVAHAETLGGEVKRDERINFNIPSQSLDDAIYVYTAVTGLEALAAGALLADRRSTDVHGTMTASEALQALLAGTGLTARFVDSGSFTLTPVQIQSASVPAADAPSDVPRYASYSSIVQNAVKRALCRQSDTRPGYYRTAIQIWVAPSGAVARALLIGTTGDVARDKALSDLFRTLVIGSPPPADLPQPATLLILPRAQASDCASADGAGGQ